MMIKLAAELAQLPADDFVRLARPASFSSPEFWRGFSAADRLRDIVRGLPDRMEGVAYGLHAQMQHMEPTRASALGAHAASLLDVAWLLRMAINAAQQAGEEAEKTQEAARQVKTARGKKPTPVKAVGARVKVTRARKVSA